VTTGIHFDWQIVLSYGFTALNSAFMGIMIYAIEHAISRQINILKKLSRLHW